MDTVKCWSCDKTFERGSKGTFTLVKQNEAGETEKVFDLCPSCFDEFKAWLEATNPLIIKGDAK